MGTQNSVLASNADYENENLENDIKINHDETLKFHEICGSNVNFDLNHKRAQRADGFCNAVVLTNRNIKVNEVVYVKFSEISDNWRGYIRFGLTCNDPYLNQNDIRKARYVCPDLTNKKGYWARSLTDDVNQNDILYFYINKDGHVYYGINKIFKGLFFNDIKINPNLRLWAIFDIYGNTISIELVDGSRAGIVPTMIYESGVSNNSLETSSITSSLSDDSSTPPATLLNLNRQTENNTNIFQVDILLSEFRGLHDNDLNESIVTNSLVKPAHNNYEVDLSLPLYRLLHHVNDKENNLKFNTKLFGKNTKFSNNYRIAYRAQQQQHTNAYVFIDKEVVINRSLCVQIISVDSKMTYSNNNNNANNEISLEFGCTNCSPDVLKQSDLPNDSYNLLNRQEYWIVNKNILNNASVGDELCLVVDNSGNIQYKVNGQLRTKCLFNVDVTQKLYFFFNICGKTTAIRLVPSCKLENKLYEKIPSNKLNPLQISKTTIHDLNRLNLNKKPIVKEECRVCLDGVIESVIYACGHMCLCWNCAIKILNDRSNNKKPLCPICRLEIKDVIRVYKS